jgi:type IV secretion system protein VirB10
MTRLHFIPAIVMLWCSTFALRAVVPERDFSGRWLLDRAASDVRFLPGDVEQSLTITVEERAVRCAGASGAQWSYALDGTETRLKTGGETRNSVVKWEGSALLINTMVSGPRNYVIMDRWKLSGDYSVLTITRQVSQGSSESEGQLVYRREGQSQPAAPAAPAQGLSRKPVPEADAQFAVPAGTHVLLETLNAVDTKHSHAGDRVYLRSVVPVFENGHLLIPRGAAVTASVTEAKLPGHGGKGELYLRFDSLTLPNGVTRDFRSRLGNADGGGKVDPDEGKITGERDPGHDVKTVGETTGAGASVGGIAGRSMAGAGLGAAGGAAAGLAYVLFKRGPDAVLPRGTRVEMILDRELRFRADELRF